MREQPPVQVGRHLGYDIDLYSLPVKALDLCLDVLGGSGQIINAACALDPPRDQLGVARKQAEDVDVLQKAEIVTVRTDREAPLVVLRHQQQRLEQEIIAIDRDDVEVAGLPDHGFKGEPPQNDR